MPKYSLTDRQKDLLRLLPKGFSEGTIEAQWTILFNIGDNMHGYFGINDQQISEAWGKAKLSDFMKFEDCKFMKRTKGENVWMLDEQAIINAVNSDFEIPTHLLPGGQQYHFGDITGSNVNINSSLDSIYQIVNHSAALSDEFKQTFESLLRTLQEQLADVPQEEGEAIAEQANILAQQVSKETPNKTSIRISAEGLKSAAETMASVAPAVFVTAVKIADFLRKAGLG